MFGRWKEVYVSTDLGEIAQRETMLGDKGIKFITKFDSALSNNRTYPTGRFAPAAETYRIFVRKKSVEAAQFIISE